MSNTELEQKSEPQLENNTNDGSIEQPFKSHDNAVDLVKEMIYLCVMGTVPSSCVPGKPTGKFFPNRIDYRYDVGINDISKDLDTLIKETAEYIDNKKDEYLELLKLIEDNEDEDLEWDRRHCFFEEIRNLLPVLYAMHPDYYGHFETMIHNYLTG